MKTIFLGSGVVLLLLALLAFWMARKSLKVQVSTAAVALLAALVSVSAEVAVTQAGQLTRCCTGRARFTARSRWWRREGMGAKERFLKLDSTMEGACA